MVVLDSQTINYSVPASSFTESSINMVKVAFNHPGSSGIKGSTAIVPSCVYNSMNVPPTLTVSRVKIEHVEEPVPYVEWKSPFSMRRHNMSMIRGSNYSPLTPTTSFYGDQNEDMLSNASKSLDLLRKNIQRLVTKDMESILQKYLQKFFHPAVRNLQQNLGVESVTEDLLRSVCRQMLEDAKGAFPPLSPSPPPPPMPTRPPSIVPQGPPSSHTTESPLLESTSDSEASCQSQQAPPIQNETCAVKRKESDTEAETDAAYRTMMGSGCIKRPRPPNACSGRAVLSVACSGRAVLSVACSGGERKSSGGKREPPIWNPDAITAQSLFILGARANKVLGFQQTRGRLYSKHPLLFKYAGDQADKEWLCKQKHMPAASGGKAYVMLMEDICKLATSYDYISNPNVTVHELDGFCVPNFMIQKMKRWMLDRNAENLTKVSTEIHKVQVPIEMSVNTPLTTVNQLTTSNQLTISSAVTTSKVLTGVHTVTASNALISDNNIAVRGIATPTIITSSTAIRTTPSVVKGNKLPSYFPVGQQSGLLLTSSGSMEDSSLDDPYSFTGC